MPELSSPCRKATRGIRLGMYQDPIAYFDKNILRKPLLTRFPAGFDSSARHGRSSDLLAFYRLPNTPQYFEVKSVT